MKLRSYYKKASALKGVVMMGAVNADGHQYLGSQGSRYLARTSLREPEVPRFVLENDYVKVSLDDRF